MASAPKESKGDPEESPSTSSAPLGPFLDILLLDDSSLIRDVFGRLLTRRGHRVHEVADVASAIERLSSVRMDAAIVDLGVPGDGVNVLRYLEGDAGFEGVIVVITGSMDAERRIGPDSRARCVRKPFKFQDLVPLIERQG